jgi:4-carboxymuconolactone decarboxylase
MEQNIMTDRRAKAKEIVSEMISPEIAELMADSENSSSFGAQLAGLALDNAFGALWTRPGLGRRDRSLVTLGILIALRATDELQIHIPAAVKNGLTQDEIAEVIYHSSGYAGFPAASAALRVARDVIK